MNTIRKADLLQKRRWRIRKKVFGTSVRPRLAVKFSSKHIYAQAVNDDTGTTLVFLSSLDADLRKQKLQPISPVPRPSANRLPPRPRPLASSRSSSTALALFIMARSKPLPRPLAPVVLPSNPSK